MDIRIDRCYCYAVRFEDLLEVATASGATTVEELQEDVDFGLNCKLCHPYVRRMLRTGEFVFREVITEE